MSSIFSEIPSILARGGNERVYPIQCTSAFCGSLECNGCSNERELTEFREWVRKTGAIKKDPIWCPLIYSVPQKKATNMGLTA